MSPVTTAFRLRGGDNAPVQQSTTTCGAACLTVARMLVDPRFAHWIIEGEGPFPTLPQLPTVAERFASYERVVHRRTNSLYTGGERLNLPWPRMLGTPPWGARKELEFGAARRGTAYEIEVLRWERPRALEERFDRLLDVVADGEPALLYVGEPRLPRHVVLILPDEGDRNLEVYDPGSGRVTALTQEAFAGRSVNLSGWSVPWFAVQPTGQAAARVFDFGPGRLEAAGA